MSILFSPIWALIFVVTTTVTGASAFYSESEEISRGAAMRFNIIPTTIKGKQFLQFGAIGLTTSVFVTTHQTWTQSATVLMQASRSDLPTWSVGSICFLVLTLAVLASSSLIEIVGEILKHGWRETFYFPPDHKNLYIGLIVLGVFLTLGTYKSCWRVVTAIVPYLQITPYDSTVTSLVSSLVALGIGLSCFKYFVKSL